MHESAHSYQKRLRNAISPVLMRLGRLQSLRMNSRFFTALHILTRLAATPDERVTSEFLASSIGTNPVVIRRQLALLREAGLVQSKGAKGGGWLLSRKPSAIRLSEIREAPGEEAP